MGLTKQYLRYIPAGNFNIIASSTCNVVFVTLEGQEGRFVAVGACEHVIIWDMRLGEKAQVLSGETSAVTCLCASPNKRHLAVGYADGNIQVFDLRSTDVLSVFSGHKYEVTELAYDQFGHKLASGSKDTDIIIWDTVAETGLCRLSGHKGPITKLSFMTKMQVLISSSKDTFVKFWDLETEHCFKTLVGHRTEVWSCVLMKDDQYLVTGSSDALLKVWKLSIDTDSDKNKDEVALKLNSTVVDDNDDLTHPLQCKEVGNLMRGGRGRVVSLSGDNNGQLLGCHGTDGLVELFHFLPDDEVQTRFKKRLKKLRKKQGEKMVNETDVENTLKESMVLGLNDEVKRLKPIQLSSKPKSLDLVLGRGGELRVAVCLFNNLVELYTMKISCKDSEPSCLRSISSQGHHSEVRAVAFSSDNLAMVSGSGESIKMWSRPTQACIRTVETPYILSLIFAPGDRHVLAGCKDGKLLIIDIASGDILEEVSAHTQELWSLILTPEMVGCVSGGGDQTVKFWQFELVVPENSESKSKVLSVLHSRTLKLEDSVLCIRLSQNGKFLAVALLDTTVKIFFVDTFKFYLSLYGHKLPVLIMDISSDSTIIATGSADRNVKIWGMDFGDCHKSIFAHDDSITGLQFIPRTHYLFTCGKDGKVKQWDCDSFNKVITLQGHNGEAYGLAVSPNGKFVLSCGSDRVLRLYEKSDQPLVLEDEEEMEREQQEQLVTGEKTVVAGHSELNLPSKKTVGSEKAAENILECLEICEQYRQQLAEHKALQAASTQVIAAPQAPLLMQAFKVSTPDDFLLETIRRIRSSDLEEALLILPFSAVCEVLQVLPTLIQRGDNIELLCKLSVFLLKLHHSPVVANHTLLTTLEKLYKLAMNKLQELRDMVGYNLYGLQFLENEIETSEGIQLFKDMTIEKQKTNKKRRQREKLKRSIMVLNS
ncbi:hypothetical protein WA026_013117 [Henosepilachna vigintioctopunctata]|uniref:Small-subunit processome Utp12 domain-containing protein n=1 Tax=Henosepilachna vigintioctopunctata TaxID=420089 RepID=A0AAW1UJV4_9CUCU